jgi:uncharacterized protein YcbK (DUF882 family)
MQEPAQPSRRRFVSLGLAAAAAALTPLEALAAPRVPRRALAFHNLHTGENLAATYWSDGRYREDALRKIDVILRDFRTGDVKRIDPKLLDVLFNLQRRLRTDEPFQVISGYRSPKTNRALAARNGGVARKSLHMQGLAIDVRLPGRRLQDVRDAALAMKAGGVGYYPKSGFVHIDAGRVRHW